MKILFLPAALVLFFCTTVRSQDVPYITGTVVDTEGDPLIGANILVTDLGRGAVTDVDGNFRINKLEDAEYDLRVSMIGYATKVVRDVLASSTPDPLKIVLEEKAVEMEEIEVVGDALRRPQEDTRVSVQKMVPWEAKFLPGAAEDVMRSLQALPGVLSPNDFSSQLIIRGSGPDQNLIVMDHIEVFNPYRLYGVVSMFNPETVSDISLLTGGFPAKYGDRLSAVLDISNRDGRSKKDFYMNLNTSLTNANLVLEGDSPLNLPGSWLVSMRRTYYDLIVGPFARSAGLVDGNVSFPNFGDVQTRLNVSPWEGHKFFVTGVTSRDGVDVTTSSSAEDPDSVSVYNTTFNHVLGTGWTYAPSDDMLNTVVFSYYNNNGISEFDGRFLDPVLDEREWEGTADSIKALARFFDVSVDGDFVLEKYSLSNEFVYHLGTHDVEAGFGWTYIDAGISFDIRIGDDLKEIIEANPRSRALTEPTIQLQQYHKFHGYLQDRIELIPNRFYLQPGLRYDYYTGIQKGYLSPRINASYAVDPSTTVRAAFGVYYQSPGYEKLFDNRQFLDFSEPYLTALRAENALHYILGVERWLDNRWLAKVDLYYKDFDDLVTRDIRPGFKWTSAHQTGTDLRDPANWADPFLVASDTITDKPINGSFGEAYGIELMLEKRNTERSDKFSGWISYALAWAQRYEEGVVIPFNFDQRHTINIVGNYKINSWLEAGARWRLGT